MHPQASSLGGGGWAGVNSKWLGHIQRSRVPRGEWGPSTRLARLGDCSQNAKKGVCVCARSMRCARKSPSEQNCDEAAIDVTSTPTADPAHAAIFVYVTASVNPSRVPSRQPGWARDGAARATTHRRRHISILWRDTHNRKRVCFANVA
jgi:hypothetical protein